VIEAALLDEYIERYSNWGRWGDDDQIGTANSSAARSSRPPLAASGAAKWSRLD